MNSLACCPLVGEDLSAEPQLWGLKKNTSGDSACGPAAEHRRGRALRGGARLLQLVTPTLQLHTHSVGTPNEGATSTFFPLKGEKWGAEEENHGEKGGPQAQRAAAA